MTGYLAVCAEFLVAQLPTVLDLMAGHFAVLAVHVSTTFGWLLALCFCVALFPAVPAVQLLVLLLLFFSSVHFYMMTLHLLTRRHPSDSD